MASLNPGDFYLACRNSQVHQVKSLLSQMSVEQINHLEMTGLGRSTALHAASYYGHYEIVQLLLEHGADPTIRNFNQATAVDEARTRDIRCLFRQHMTANDTPNTRFGQSGPDLEWIAVDDEIIRKAPHYRQWLKTGSHNMEYSAHTIRVWVWA